MSIKHWLEQEVPDDAPAPPPSPSYEYELYGVIEHLGNTPQSGHYTANIKS